MKKKPGVMVYFELRGMLKLLTDEEKGNPRRDPVLRLYPAAEHLRWPHRYVHHVCVLYAVP